MRRSLLSLVFVACQRESDRRMIQTVIEGSRPSTGHYKSSYMDLRLLPHYPEPPHHRLTSIFSTPAIIPKRLVRLTCNEVPTTHYLYSLACAFPTLGYLVISSPQTSLIHNETERMRDGHGCGGPDGACGLLNRSLLIGSIQGFLHCGHGNYAWSHEISQ